MVSPERLSPAGAGGAGRVARTASPRRLGLWISLGWVIVTTLAAILANVLPLIDPLQVGAGDPGLGPSLTHLLGTDELGRDVLSRLIYGARVSLAVGFGATIIAVVGGLAVGLIAGYFRGWVDGLLSLATDTLLAFPALVFALAVVAFVGPSVPVVIATMGLFGIAPMARVVRGATIQAVEREFVTAARLLGARPRRVITREVLPFIAIPTVSFTLIAMAVVIVTEAALSFFGIDVVPPTPSWGNMINEGMGVMRDNPLLVLWPSLALFITVIALNYVADSIQGRFTLRAGFL